MCLCLSTTLIAITTHTQALIDKKFWPAFKPDMSRYDAKVEAEKATRHEIKSELTGSLTESLTASLTTTITESTRSSMEVELRAPIAQTAVRREDAMMVAFGDSSSSLVPGLPGAKL